jgi:type I restriction-modification system DNA methylase subunit
MPRPRWFTLLNSCERSSEHLLALLFLHDLCAPFTPATPPPEHSWQRLQRTPEPQIPGALAAACEACIQHWGAALEGFLDDVDFAALNGPVLQHAIERMTRWPVTDGHMKHPLTRLADVYQATRSLSAQQWQGAFFTPYPAASLIARKIGMKPWTTVFDPACGAGAMLIAALDALRQNRGERAAGTLKLLGIEINSRTAAVARASLVLAGAHPNQFWIATGDGLHHDIVGRDRSDGKLKTLRFHVHLANPPFGSGHLAAGDRGETTRRPLVLPDRVLYHEPPPQTARSN